MLQLLPCLSSQNLPEKDINAGFEHAERADLCLAMGSSLTVTPAANIPERVAERYCVIEPQLHVSDFTRSPMTPLLQGEAAGHCEPSENSASQ